MQVNLTKQQIKDIIAAMSSGILSEEEFAAAYHIQWTSSGSKAEKVVPKEYRNLVRTTENRTARMRVIMAMFKNRLATKGSTPNV